MKVFYHYPFPSIIHKHISFHRQLSRIGRPGHISQVTGFDKPAFSLDGSEYAGL